MTFIERQALCSISDHFKFILQKYIVLKFWNEAALFYKFPYYKFQWTSSFNSRRIRLGRNFQSLALIVSCKFLQKLIFPIEGAQGHLFLTDNKHTISNLAGKTDEWRTSSEADGIRDLL